MTMDPEYAKESLIYCPRCGNIPARRGCDTCCSFCGYEHTYQIDPKWNITNGENNKIYQGYVNGKYDYIGYGEELLWHEKPFIQEVVMKSDVFDPELHEKYIEEFRDRIRKKSVELWHEKHGKNIPKAQPNTQRMSIVTVQCPYCKSCNTKKISAASRALSIGVLGWGSSKIGKQWHCTNCGSDF